MIRAFKSPVQVCFETGLHRSRSGSRIDHGALTRHDRFAALDYARLARLGVETVREGVRWPAVEYPARHYDFGVLAPRIHAARMQGTEIVWTLLDGGWPDDLDPMQPEFVGRFAAFAGAFARFLRDDRADHAPWIVPIDQIGPRAWLGGEVAHAEPYLEERGLELQTQLVRAALAAADAFRSAIPGARLICAEPLLHVSAHPDRPGEIEEAAAYDARRHSVLDMLIGRIWPQLGGGPRYVDLVGLYYYPDSQRYYAGPKYPGPAIPPAAPGWRALRELVIEAARRSARPVFIAGTGRDDAFAPAWFSYVCREAQHAACAGACVAGVGLHPAVDCPPPTGRGRPARGIWGDADAAGQRQMDTALAERIALECALFADAQRDSAPSCPMLGTTSGIEVPRSPAIISRRRV